MKLMRSGRKKLEIIQSIIELLEKEKSVPISQFTKIGIPNAYTLEYIELINWVLDHAKHIDVKQGGKIKLISFKE